MLWSLCIQVYEGPMLPRGPEQQRREETSVQLGVCLSVPLPGLKAQVWGRFQRREPGWRACRLPGEKIPSEKKRWAAFAFALAFGGCEMRRSSPANSSFPVPWTCSWLLARLAAILLDLCHCLAHGEPCWRWVGEDVLPGGTRCTLPSSDCASRLSSQSQLWR